MFRLTYILFLFFFIQKIQAQNFEWLRAYGTKNGHERNYDVAGTKDGGSVFILSYYKVYQTGTYDTIRFGNFEFPIYSNTSIANQSFIIKVDSTGKVIKVNTMSYFATRQIICNKDGDFLVAGIVGGFQDSSVIGNKSYFRANGATVVLKYDKDLNLIWAKQMGGGNTAIWRLNFSDNALTFIFTNKDTAKIGSKSYFLSGSAISYIYGEMDPINGSVKWSQSIGDSSINLKAIIKINNKIYLSGFLFNGLKIGSDTLFPNSGIIIQSDSLGNYEKSYCLRTRNTLLINDLATDSKNIYFCGYFVDSVYWDKNKVIAPGNKTGTVNRELFAAAISLNFKPLWFFRPEIISKTVSPSSLNYIVYNQGFLYYGGTLTNSIRIDSTVLGPSSIGAINIIILKTDIRGNVLWATSGGENSAGTVYGLDAIAGQSVFATGDFYKDTLQIGKLMVTSPNFGKTTDVFITKLSDNGIIRGTVKSGPYCSGDSITIPYTKIGSYDTANYFMAQLSNEEGNFDKGFVNLGRIKSNKDGTIKGKIPQSNISSSGKYRIRIMSTLPAVQSYYKADTLRLLIYSRDKANPGPDTAICPGDTLLLRTYGGTKWKWSPGLRMQDSSNYNQNLAQ